ncbi:MAG: cytochrome c oxidase subunit 3 [Candidatus Thermoplasmatota archaeon]|nr:cytochrome c oxidase subunit 3 [Candidatus Thermoplasmatota archaeon]
MSYGDHDDHGHHGSWAPIIASLGTMIFLYGFSEADMGITAIGLVVLIWGLFTWWKGDLPFDGSEKMGELKSFGTPFGGMNIRKAGIWLFLMSEVMIFGSFFGAYMRMRTNWNTHWTLLDKAQEAIDSSLAAPGATAKSIYKECLSEKHKPMVAQCEEATGGLVNQTFWYTESGTPVYQHVAAEYITADFWTLLPGAINTFALILSSFTVVLALKAAKNVDLDPKVRDKKVRNYLAMTLMLGTLFLILKLWEWNHLIHDYDFTISTLAGSFFYVTTGAHGVHVFVGLVFLTYFIYKAHIGGWDHNNAQSIEYYGLYWHFVDLAWVIIFPAFYLY